MTEAPMPAGLGDGASAPLSPWGQEAPRSGAPVLTTQTSSALPSLEAPRDRCFLPSTHHQPVPLLHPPTQGMVLSISIVLHITNADFCPDDAVLTVPFPLS